MKKTLSLFLILIIIFSFAGCKQSAKQNNATIDDAKRILDKHSLFYTEEEGSIYVWITLYQHNGYTFSYENKSVITDLEKTFGIPSYDDLLDLCDAPNQSKKVKTKNVDIEIHSLPTKNKSKIISIAFEEIN